MLTDKRAVEVRATGVRFDRDILRVLLSDGREIAVPLNRIPWLNWLYHATSQQREKWTIEPGGYAIYWEDLDDGIEIGHLLDSKPLV